MKLIGRLFLVGAVILATACGGSTTAPASTAIPTISAAASAHLNEIVDQMQAHWYFSSTMNWTTFRASVLDAGRSAQTIADTYQAIKLALTLLGDKHSYYVTSGGEFIYNPDSPSAFGVCAANSAPPFPPTFPDIGFLKVQIYPDGDPQVRAAEIQDAIRAQDRSGLVGWIVDMRNSHGGNLWPTLAGLGSILGNGRAGFFIGPNNSTTGDWGYSANAAYNNGTNIVNLTSPVQLRVPNPRVAVLTDVGISSSGEAITVAFRERPNTRSFGLPTCGLSTAISQFALTTAKGSTIGVVDGIMADRTRHPYGSFIVPDELISDNAAIVTRAVAWLRGQ
jgi:carboxyl-terminal processing protease